MRLEACDAGPHSRWPGVIFGDQRRTPLTPRHEQESRESHGARTRHLGKVPRPSVNPGPFFVDSRRDLQKRNRWSTGTSPKRKMVPGRGNFFKEGTGAGRGHRRGQPAAGRPGRKQFAKCRSCEYSEILLVAPLIMTRLVSSFDGAWWAAALLWRAEAEEAKEAEQGGPGCVDATCRAVRRDVGGAVVDPYDR